MPSTGYYTASEAARIAHVPRSTVDYWARTGLIEPSQRRARPRLYSFEDLRDLVVAKKLRDQDAGVRDIRTALRYVRSVDDVMHLAEASFSVTDGELEYEDAERGIPTLAPHRGGQRVFNLNMRDVFDDLGVVDIGVPVLAPSPGVVIDPRIRGGTPVILGTRIPTRLIAELRSEGLSDEEILSLYPSLTTDDIAAAVEWESSLAA